MSIQMGSGGPAAWQWVCRAWSHVCVLQGLDVRAARGCRGMSIPAFQLPAAARSLWAVVALGGQSSVTGHSLNRFVLREPKQMEAGLGFHGGGTPWTQYCRGYCHLFCMFALFSASLWYHVIKYIFHVKWFYRRAKSHFSGKWRNTLSSKCKAEASIPQTSPEGVGDNWVEFLLPSYKESSLLSVRLLGAICKSWKWKFRPVLLSVPLKIRTLRTVGLQGAWEAT